MKSTIRAIVIALSALTSASASASGSAIAGGPSDVMTLATAEYTTIEISVYVKEDCNSHDVFLQENEFGQQEVVQISTLMDCGPDFYYEGAKELEFKLQLQVAGGDRAEIVFPKEMKKKITWN